MKLGQTIVLAADLPLFKKGVHIELGPWLNKQTEMWDSFVYEVADDEELKDPREVILTAKRKHDEREFKLVLFKSGNWRLVSGWAGKPIASGLTKNLQIAW